MPRPTKRTTTILQADVVRLQNVVRESREALGKAQPLAPDSQREYERRAAVLDGAMPRQPKQTTPIVQSATSRLHDVVRKARAALDEAQPLAPDSQREYKRRAAILDGGWDMAKAGKNERYLMRAAGTWQFLRKIKETLKEADKAKRSKEDLEPVRAAKWAMHVQKAQSLMNKLDEFRALPWNSYDNHTKQQAGHKKSAATDAQLEAFFEAAAGSQFRDAFLVMEFTGCRGVELAKGVRVEVEKKNGTVALRFFIESAKCDGKKKGLDLRAVVSEYPADASKAVQRRWMELANRAGKARKPIVIAVEPTESLDTGRRLTKIISHFAKKAGQPISGYSLRHRVSAQLKTSGDSGSTAAALGHQTTETQRYYGRSKRGGGGVSPIKVSGVNLSGAPIRGPKQRTGPPEAYKTRAALRASTPNAKALPAMARRSQRL
ncbi:MAG: hypothetical protein V4631_01860 [Pseudomonadota bacterium]